MSKKEPLSNLRKPVAAREAPAASPELEHQVLGGGAAPASALESIRRNRPEPRATITVQLPFELDLQLEERANQLGIKKREIIVRGIQLALGSSEFSL